MVVLWFQILNLNVLLNCGVGEDSFFFFKEISLVSALFSASLKEHSQFHNKNDIKMSLYRGRKIVHLSIT